jgi:hypothetical protein
MYFMKNLMRVRKNFGQKNISFFSGSQNKSEQSNVLKNNYISGCFIVNEF